MMSTHRLAIDFGTTNSVVACQRAADRRSEAGPVELLSLPDLSQPEVDGQPPLIPSLLYVHDGQRSHTVSGQAVRDRHLDRQRDHRLFRNFKRGLVAAPAPPPRQIDGCAWGDRDAGEHFLRQVLAALPYSLDTLDAIVLTAPVVSFEGYVAWLARVLEDGAAPVRVVDEATAAAVGYAVTEPGALVLVFDFGGGTLDLALVQLPEGQSQTGRFLSRFRESTQGAARVVAKAGHVLGGSDIDQWLLAAVLDRAGLSTADLGDDYAALLTRCEAAKIALSEADAVPLDFSAAGRDHHLTISRADLEALLTAQGFYGAIRRAIDKVLHIARQGGTFREDIHAVLLVGGASLMPSVQALVETVFAGTPVLAHKPFTAVVEGALHVAAGCGLDDYVVHSYGLRHLDAATGAHAYDELIPAGTRYPMREPVKVLLGAAHADQVEVEFVIGEIATGSVDLIEVRYEGDQAVFVAKADAARQQIVPLNGDEPLCIRLQPPGVPDAPRLQAAFHIDDQRHLRLTVTDRATRKKLLRDAVVLTLR